MKPVTHYVFPSALIASLILSALGLFLMAGVTLPAHASELTLYLPTMEIASAGVAETADQLQSAQVPPPSSCQVSPKFPPNILQWCDWITYYAQLNHLPPDLIAALIWQESGGDPLAYSHSGAVGLMQVMPRDGIAASFICPNGPCFANRPSMRELQDPRFNIEYGTAMLAGLLANYGDLREALRFYGPKDVGYSYADKVLTLYQNYKQ